MLSPQHRITKHTEFSSILRQGKRIGSNGLILYVQAVPDMEVSRMGLIISKAVGNAVVRHRIARQLRHVFYSLLSDIPPGWEVVLRVLPGESLRTSCELHRQIMASLYKAGVMEQSNGSMPTVKDEGVQRRII